MKTQNKNLVFKKESISELNDAQLSHVNGGGTPLSISLAVVLLLAGCDDHEDDPCEDGGAGCGAGGGGGSAW